MGDFDKVFSEFCRLVVSRTKNIIWEFRQQVDKWDMNIVSTATVEINGKVYQFKCQTNDWQMNWDWETPQVELEADITVHNIFRQISRGVFEAKE